MSSTSNQSAEEIGELEDELAYQSDRFEEVMEGMEELDDELRYQSDQFEQARKDLEDQRRELERTQYELEATRKQLEGTRLQLEGTRLQLEGTTQQYEGTLQELKVTRQELEATREELEAERQSRLDLDDQGADVLREINEALIGATVHVELRNEFDADGLISLAAQLREVERLITTPDAAIARLAIAKGLVQTLADRHHFQVVNRVLANLNDAVSSHTQPVAELVVDKFIGSEDETILIIRHVLRAIRQQEILIKGHPHMDPSEKKDRLQNLPASVWAQVKSDNKFPFDTYIVPRSDLGLNIRQLADHIEKEDLYERMREELES